MKTHRRSNGPAVAISMAIALPCWAQDDASNRHKLEEVFIFGESGKTDVATNLNLTNLETPQTVTTISRAQLDDFALTSINKVLDYTSGVTVEEIETDRTYYTARGFDIVNFQYDGVGIPFISGINLGQQDTAIYQKVEVVKGAAGLITGLANPSATINYVRKRPTEDLQASVAASLGEWQGRRLDADVSGSIATPVSGRLVVAYDDSESYLDRHEDETKLAYGVLAFDLSDLTKLTVGHSYDNSFSKGVLWGALPLLYSDGTQTDYGVSTSNAPDWTFADSVQEQTFIDFKQELSESWSFNAHLVQNHSTYDSELFYVYGTPDAETEVGLFGWASAYQRNTEQANADIFVAGDFDLFGRSHQLVVGYSHSDTDLKEKSYSDPANGFPVLGGDWAEGSTPAMNFDSHDPASQASDIDLSQKAFYVATRIHVLEGLAVLAGARSTELEQSGISYGGDANAEANETVPYFGITWEAIDSFVLYVSYSEVFKQQTWVNVELLPLGPTLGKSTELGVKQSFNDGRAVLTVARFNSDQDNFGEFIGRNNDGVATYEGRTLESSGYEIELSGEITEGLNIGTGFTYVDIKDANGNDGRVFIPSKMLKLSASYQMPFLPSVRLGGVIKWQDDISTADEQVRQEAYTLVDLAAHYQISDNLGVSMNVDNLFDEKYLNSLYWNQAYYGAPRNISVSVRWEF